MNSRRLKIARRYRCSRGLLRWSRSLPPMPFLPLQGRWLDEAGFAIGAQVRVEVMRGRLVLEVLESEHTVGSDVKRARRPRAD